MAYKNRQTHTIILQNMTHFITWMDHNQSLVNNVGIRRCTIHRRTLTKTLTQTHNESLQFRTHLDQSRNCVYPLSRNSGCDLLILCWSTRERVVAALGRRWNWRLWRATCRRASRRVPSPGTVGGQAVFTNTMWLSSEEIRLHVMSVVLKDVWR